MPSTALGEFFFRQVLENQDFNYILGVKPQSQAQDFRAFFWLKMKIRVREIVPAEHGGHGLDVEVPPDPRRYDARTIISMVKLVNRRGTARFVCRIVSKLDGEVMWAVWKKPKERIPGYNEQREWVEESILEDRLFVSFSDRFEAERFCADLQSIRDVRLKRGPKPQLSASRKDPRPQM